MSGERLLGGKHAHSRSAPDLLNETKQFKLCVPSFQCGAPTFLIALLSQICPPCFTPPSLLALRSCCLTLSCSHTLHPHLLHGDAWAHSVPWVL